MIESPKRRFLATNSAGQLLEWINNPALADGLDAAILQMVYESGAAKTPDTAAALHWQLTGAYRLRDIFLQIALIEKPQPQRRTDNLPNEL